MIAWFTRNHVAANLLMFSIVITGLYSLFTQLPLEVFPEFEADNISVRMSLRGATPEDVEQGLTIRIEEAVQDLEGIKQIRSRSSEGSAVVTIEVDNGYDPRDMLADVKSRVDAVNTFPADAEKPVTALAQFTPDVINVTVSGPYSEKETREFAEKVRDDLLRIQGVTQLALDGVRDYEIAIEISQDKLRQYQLSIAQISNAIQNSSVDISAGNLRSSGGDILLRSKGQAYYKDEFANIIVKSLPDGSLIKLADVANINDDFEESPVRTRFNGKQAAFIEVFRIGDQSAIEVADKVKDYIARQQNNLPTGYELSYWDDDSVWLKSVFLH
jgi:multidrug efflux pump subunit AcrB